MDSSSDLYSNLKYLNGFGNTFASEALPGAIPAGKQKPIQARTAPSSLSTDFTPSSSPALLSPSSEPRTRKCGTIS